MNIFCLVVSLLLVVMFFSSFFSSFAGWKWHNRVVKNVLWLKLMVFIDQIVIIYSNFSVTLLHKLESIKGLCKVHVKKKPTLENPTQYYNTLNYTTIQYTLYYTTLNCITLHHTTLQSSFHALHFTLLHCYSSFNSFCCF